MFFTGSRYIVAGVTLLIAYLGITSQIFVFIPWLRTISLTTTLAALVPFNLGVAIIYWHYYLACTTDPGSPPPGWGNPEKVQEKSNESSSITKTVNADNLDHATSGQSTAIQSTHGPAASVTSTGPTTELRDRTLRSDTNNNPSSTDPTLSEATPQHPPTETTPKKSTGPLPRYCRTCEAFKPPRSHHCRICKRCVLKMDHHCPWINNCVGHFNYGHFIRFVTWVTITTGYCMILLVARVWDAVKYENYYRYRDDGPDKLQTSFMIINIFVDGGVLIAVGILCIYHLWSMISNTSTIEVWEREKVDAMIKKGKMQKVKYPYDVGCLKNYRQVLGPRVWLWFLWPQPLVDSGTEFEVIRDKNAAKIWPPREYRTTKYKNQTFVSDYTTSAIGGRNRKRYDDNREQTGSAGRGQNKSEGSRAYPTHVRRGSEGWIVQDLTIQQRVQLYDQQLSYEHGQSTLQDPEENRDEEEEYQEGLSDIEGESVMARLPGGMQGGRQQDYEDNDGGEDDESIQSIPYDLPSDEYDEDEYDEDAYDNEGNEDDFGDDDYFDEQNPYLGYDDEDEEDNYEEEEEEVEDQQDEGLEDEVSLMGRDRRMIGRFFDHLDPTSPSYKGPNPELGDESDEDEEGGEIDEWDEGEGIQVGCVPPSVSGKIESDSSRTKNGISSKTSPPTQQAAFSPSGTPFNPNGKTFYDILVEREQALQKKTGPNGAKKGRKKK